MKTGTARYLSLFLEECGDILRDHQPVIVTPSGLGAPNPSLRGIPIVSDRDYCAAENDVLFVFVANNRFHMFVFSILERRKKSSRVISIIHDPQCFMNVDHIQRNLGRKYDPEGMVKDLKFEIPNLREWIMSRWQQAGLPQILKFNLMAQSRIIEASDVMVVHSYYAALKLLLESGHGVERMPPILVMQHPRHPSIEGHPLLPRGRKFVVGCFGWISQAKRPIPIISGFSRFLSSLPAHEREAVELKFVGELTQKSLDPSVLAQAYGCEKNCVHLGHVSDERFLREMSTVNIMFNLRFPSCGETSGTLNLAKEMGIRVAMTNYQAFKEENADFLISLAPDKEVDEICAAITAVYRDWIAGKATTSRAPSPRYALPKKFDARQALQWVLSQEAAA